MALLIEPESELIPGYRLLERLGAGGFGEVWKAQAPGGLLKAIKITHDDLERGDTLSRQRAEQELSALKRVQAVRHPYLLSIDRYDIIDGRLLIVTELADCNLWDRFQQYRARRQPGIPRDDLLRYLSEAAEVLDLMNAQYQLQHLDVKPQNLFLVHDHVKVADFGLVRDLDGVKADTTGGATPYYAAPESFEGNISPFCDQYSLAVVYQELLTGKRPFQAVNMQQLITQHLQSAPNVNALPPGDRAAVARALSKRPEDRHPTCLAFIRTLMAGGGAVVTASATAAPPAPMVPDGRGGSSFLETPATQMLFRPDDETPSAENFAPRPTPPEQTGEGVLFPALVIGIGEVGLEVLHRVRQSIVERFENLNRLPTVRLLYIDTDPESIQSATEPTAASPLDPNEVFPARLNRPAHYLKPRRHGRSIIEGWFDPQLLYRIKAGNPSTQGLRSLGRLAFCDHYRVLEQKLRDDLEAITRTEAMDHAEIHCQLALRNNRPRVYVVAGLGGGTGSGMFIDVAFAVRHRLRLMGYTDPDVIGVLLLPPTAGPFARPLPIGNAFAALTELNHYSTPGVAYMANIDDKDVTLLDQSPPFRRFALLPIRDGHHNESPGLTTASEFLWRDMLTPFGRSADECREHVQSMPGVAAETGVVAGQSCGLKSLTWPRRQLLDRTAGLICCHLLEKWTATNTDDLRALVQQWIGEQWTAQQLAPESVLPLLEQVCEHAIGQSFESSVTAAVESFAPKSRWGRSTYDPAEAFQALARLTQVVGQPSELGKAREPGLLEQTLINYCDGLQRELTGKLHQLAVCLIEQPDFRLAGAEEAIAGLKQLLEQVAGHYEPLYQAREQQANYAYRRAQKILEEDVRRRNVADLAEQLQAFATSRYQWLIGRFLSQVYTNLHEHVGDCLSKIGFCRQRLTQLKDRFSPGTMFEMPVGMLLPEGCQTAEEAVNVYMQPVEADGMRELDLQMQGMVEQQFTALAHVCLSSSDLLINLESAMINFARQHMQQRLGEADVIEMFLARVRDADHARKHLTRAFADAETMLQAPESPPDSVELLAVPVGNATDQFLQLVQYSLPQTGLTLTSSPDDVVFYREQVTVPLKCLPHLGPAGRAAYEQMIGQQFPPHARIDVRQWYRADTM